MMPKMETIKASDAPPPPKKMSESARAIVNGLEALKKDEVLRLEPDPGKSMRGLKTALGRIAKSHNLKVESWTDEDQQYLFVRKV
jgi:hypothetical protein